MSKQELKQKGFTIIEVVLVLAIAALIFLMVFIALPALQRNQRDAARKQELQKVVSGITTWQSNHRGVNPTAGDAEDFAKYIDAVYDAGAITLPNTTVTFVANGATGTSSASTDTIVISANAGCNDNQDAFAAPKTSRQAAAVVQMENGDAFFCQAS
ncbi:MAG: prepilin-type N-terminal cleavage/methylation domain-containing protein [Candidatus Saccharimonas sp.]